MTVTDATGSAPSASAHLGRVLSGDSHLECDSKWWIGRVAPKHRDRAPRVIHLPDGGGDAWIVEGSPLSVVTKPLYGGRGRDQWRPWAMRYEDTPGTGPATQRLDEQHQDGIDGEVLFPGVGGPRLWASIADRDPYLAVVRAYNSYLAEEYCAVDPNRLFGVGVIPWTGLDDAIAEMEWCKQAGLRAVLLGVFPNGGGMPKPQDDRFWAASLDLEMAVAIHVQLDRNGPRAGPWMEYPNADPGVAKRATTDVIQEVCHYARTAGFNAMQLAMSGLFDRFPELQVFFAETMIGWLPLFMEAADDRYENLLPWIGEVYGWEPVKLRPSEYVRNNCHWSFMRDRSGVLLREVMGVDHLIWASDFPHYETDFPESHSVIDRNFEGVPIDEVRLMTSENIARLFRLA